MRLNPTRLRRPLSPGQRAWLGLAVLLMLGALLGWPFPHERWDWQPSLAAAQPWRVLSAVAVHYSTAHLAANLVGAVLVAALGVSARAPPAMVWAWAAAWPLTHLGLLFDPDLAHYGGLSGVLHAGVAVAACQLLRDDTRARRRIGVAVLLGLSVKVIGEAPWFAPRYDALLGISVAPLAHACGLVAGLVCAGVAALQRPR